MLRCERGCIVGVSVQRQPPVIFWFGQCVQRACVVRRAGGVTMQTRCGLQAQRRPWFASAKQRSLACGVLYCAQRPQSKDSRTVTPKLIV
jgi:hypothetical protein